MPVPIVRTVYSTTTQLGWSEVVTCPHCGLKSRAGVVARGRGSGSTVYGIGADSAKENAAIDAFSSAVTHAKAMIARARCPKCGKRAGGVAWLGIKATFLWLGIALFAVAMVAPLTGKDPGRVSAFVSVVAVALLATWSVRRGLAHADQMVRFEPVEGVVAPPPEVASAPAPAPRPARRPPPAPAAAPADPDALELDLDRSWQKKD